MKKVSKTASNSVRKTDRTFKVVDRVHAELRRRSKPRNELEDSTLRGVLKVLWVKQFMKREYGAAKLTPDQRRSYVELMAVVEAAITNGMKLWADLRAMPASRAFALPAVQATSEDNSAAKHTRRRR